MKTIDVYVLMAEDIVVKVTASEKEAIEWGTSREYWYSKEPLTLPQETQVQRDY